MFGLADVNNFYVSCERVFMPRLEGKPVLILSNNDGCVIARSNEAKALNIAMGEPFFKIKHLHDRFNIEVFSSNFALYADMSDRVMSVLKEKVSKVEVYSIDEAFLELSELPPNDLKKFGLTIIKKLKRDLGLPVSLGIAPTKTLAKVANHVAKKAMGGRGVCVLNDEAKINQVLAQIQISDIWGIGRKTSAKMAKFGIRTALQFKQQDKTWVLDHFHRGVHDTLLELQGVSCGAVSDDVAPKKSIRASRSFNQKVMAYEVLKKALVCHVTRAAEELRAQHSLAHSMEVFIGTSRFAHTDNHYENSVVVPFETPTEDTRKLIYYAHQGLAQLYRAGYRYHRAGVTLFQLQDKNEIIQDLFTVEQDEKSKRVMSMIDEINHVWGRGTLRFASDDARHFFENRGRRTPAYTTCWESLCYVKASDLCFSSKNRGI